MHDLYTLTEYLLQPSLESFVGESIGIPLAVESLKALSTLRPEDVVDGFARHRALRTEFRL